MYNHRTSLGCDWPMAFRKAFSPTGSQLTRTDRRSMLSTLSSTVANHVFFLPAQFKRRDSYPCLPQIKPPTHRGLRLKWAGSLVRCCRSNGIYLLYLLYIIRSLLKVHSIIVWYVIWCFIFVIIAICFCSFPSPWLVDDESIPGTFRFPSHSATS